MGHKSNEIETGKNSPAYAPPEHGAQAHEFENDQSMNQAINSGIKFELNYLERTTSEDRRSGWQSGQQDRQDLESQTSKLTRPVHDWVIHYKGQQLFVDFPKVDDIYKETVQKERFVSPEERRITGEPEPFLIGDFFGEKVAARNIRRAIASGDPREIEQTLSELAQHLRFAENSKFFDAVNEQLKNYTIGDGSGPAFIRLEQIVNRHGYPVLQLSMSKNDNWSKSSGSTTLTIDSEGNMSGRRNPPGMKFDRNGMPIDQSTVLNPLTAMDIITRKRL